MNFGRWLIPKWSWAFPTGPHHQLLVAAIGSDDATSLAAAQNWLTTQDIDPAPFRDHRLLLAIVGRFGAALREHSAYPRLIGLQRLLWTKSRLATQEATPSLQSLSAAGIELLLIKGASRLALNQGASKHRVAWDIDLVVKRECMGQAFDILVAENWCPAPGTSPQYLRKHMASIRGLNLFRGDYGDLDLHSRPFHPGQGGEEEDATLWAAAERAEFAGTSVWVPSAEDRIALALAHGGLDGHAHSDWLVDYAQILNAGGCRWDRLLGILLSRQLAPSAAITFHYLSDCLGYEIPEGFLTQLSRTAARRPLAMCSSLIQARPKERSGPVGKLLRGIAKKQRKKASFRQMPAKEQDHRLAVRRIPSVEVTDAGDFVSSFRLKRTHACSQQETLELDIVLDVRTTSVRRRIEMEIISASAHLCRARFRPLVIRPGLVRLRLSGTIPNDRSDETLELVSRPGKQLRRYASAAERERYEHVPFRVVSCQIR